MLKYPLFLITYLLTLWGIYIVLVIFVVLIILRGVLWDFKFQLGKNSLTSLSLLDVLKGFIVIPYGLWFEIVNLYKL